LPGFRCFQSQTPILVPAAYQQPQIQCTTQMARQRVAPDKILSMSQASRKSDDRKILSGVSQSQRSDELIEIVQYSQFQPLPLKQLYRVIWWEFQISLFRSGFSLKNKSRYKSNHPIWRMLPNLSWCSHHYFGCSRCSRLNQAILWADSLSL
jgi:hypothetical protein